MLKQRVLTALVLVGSLLLALFLLPALAWLVLAALVCAGAAWEWGALTGLRGPTRPIFAVFAGLLCLAVGLVSGLDRPDGAAAWPLLGLYLVSALFWIALVPNWLRRKWRVAGVPAALTVGVVVLLPPALAFAHLRQVGPWVLLAAMALVWIADIAAYFAGRAFGRRKLAPAISPGKTWEGAAGAVLGVLIYGAVLFFALRADGLAAANLLVVLPILVLLTALSIAGDLFESLLKRQAGLKDSGSLLPGHGGILDRIDSLTSTLPLVGLAALWLSL